MPTSVMSVVSNTSPLSNLAIIGQLELVREQLGNQRLCSFLSEKANGTLV